MAIHEFPHKLQITDQLTYCHNHTWIRLITYVIFTKGGSKLII